MAFIAHKHDDGQAKPYEYLPVTGSLSVEPGTAMIVTSGKLALATGTNKPTYICETKIAATTSDEIIPVSRCDDARIYETVLSEADADMAIGEKHTIDATGGKITGTTASGVAEIVSFDGTGAGDKVRVRF